jgi:hypothetical protein
MQNDGRTIIACGHHGQTCSSLINKAAHDLGGTAPMAGYQRPRELQVAFIDSES